MIRITSGTFRGRSVRTPPGESTRPTLSKLRSALFNSIQFHLPEANVLDLFAGSGALAFEAISRGAAHATLVDKNRKAIEIINSNAAELGCLEQCEILTGEVLATTQDLAQAGKVFDVIVADPPYEAGYEMKLLEGVKWDQILVKGGMFCLEWMFQKKRLETLPDRVGVLVKVREKQYGDSVLTSYLREES